MKLMIDIPEKEYERLPYIDILKLRKYIENGTPIDYATNGDVIKVMFPNAKIVKTDKEVFLYTGTREKDEDIQIFDTEWWDESYQKGGKVE